MGLLIRVLEIALIWVFPVLLTIYDILKAR